MINKILILCSLFSFAFSMTGVNLAKLMDERKKPTDIKSIITMKIENKKGKIRTSSIKSFSKNNSKKQILWFTKPADDKGVAFLKIEHKNKDDEMRLWLPAFKRTRRISSKTKSDSFMGSDMSYEDMTSRNSKEYEYKIIGEEKIDTLDCYILQSIPKKKSEYSKHITWVTKETILPIKEHSFDNNDTHLKNKFMSYGKIKDYYILIKLHVENIKKNHQTTLNIDDIIVDSNIHDNVFQEKNLKRMNFK